MSGPILSREDQVARPDLCAHLVEMGAPTETLYHWSGVRSVEQSDLTDWRLFQGAPNMREIVHQSKSLIAVPAYNVAELGCLIRNLTDVYTGRTVSQLLDWPPLSSRLLQENTDEATTIYGVAECTKLTPNKEADARALLLIHFIKNGYAVWPKAAIAELPSAEGAS